jgi:hypothetical protein
VTKNVHIYTLYTINTIKLTQMYTYTKYIYNNKNKSDTKNIHIYTIYTTIKKLLRHLAKDLQGRKSILSMTR